VQTLRKIIFFSLFFVEFLLFHLKNYTYKEANYRGAEKSLARPTSRCILFDGENISFDASLVIYVGGPKNSRIC